MCDIGKAIRWARLNRGITSVALAQMLGCDRSWLHRMEKGLHSPSWEFVTRACAALGLHREEVLCGRLPSVLASMTARKLALVYRRLKKAGLDPVELDLAANGLRCPSDAVVQELAAVLKRDRDAMMFGT